MKSLSKYEILFSAAVLLVSGCAGNLTEQDIKSVGHPEIVYVQPAANLTSFSMSSQGAAYASGGATGMLIAAEIDRDVNGIEQETLAKHANQIKALGFDDQMYSAFSSVVVATPWLSGIAIHKYEQPFDSDDHTRQSSADSVIYLIPSFSMTPGNQHFIVDIKVKVQRRDARTKKVVDDFRSQEFRFNHDLTLIRPGMSWQQQKALAHQVASMNSEEALHAWFANESALLRTDFASDLKQVNEGLKLFFGDQAN